MFNFCWYLLLCFGWECKAVLKRREKGVKFEREQVNGSVGDQKYLFQELAIIGIKLEVRRLMQRKKRS